MGQCTTTLADLLSVAKRVSPSCTPLPTESRSLVPCEAMQRRNVMVAMMAGASLALAACSGGGSGSDTGSGGGNGSSVAATSGHHPSGSSSSTGGDGGNTGSTGSSGSSSSSGAGSSGSTGSSGSSANYGVLNVSNGSTSVPLDLTGVKCSVSGGVVQVSLTGPQISGEASNVGVNTGLITLGPSSHTKFILVFTPSGGLAQTFSSAESGASGSVTATKKYGVVNATLTSNQGYVVHVGGNWLCP